MVPRIPYSTQYIDDADIAAVVEVLRHPVITGGPWIDRFESAIARYVGARYAVAVSSGTAALHIAALAAGVGPGRVAITSCNTFVASANAARYAGADSHFSDIEPLTLNMSPAELEKECRRLGKVNLIVPVHFAGLACDMPAIQTIAQEYGAKIVEDAAHALGGRYPDDGGRIGNCRFSDMTVFSFHPVKAITTGEGGLVTTNDERLYRKLLRLRSHGINKLDDPLIDLKEARTGDEPNVWYYEMQELGFNYRMTDIQAGLGLSQFAKLERFLERKRTLAVRYDALWRDHRLVRPAQTQGRELNAHHLYVVRIDFRRAPITRTRLIRSLKELGIGTQVHYIPASYHPYYRALGFEKGRFPAAEAYYRETLSLPLYYGLSDENQRYVVESVSGLLE